MQDMSTETPAVETPPIVEAGEGGQGGGAQTPNPFFESFKEKYGTEVASEEAFHTTVGEWKSRAGIAAQKEAEANEWKQKYEEASGKQVDYQSDATRAMDAHLAKLKADGVPIEELPRKLREYFEEATTDYRALAVSNPKAVLERHYAMQGYSPERIADRLGDKVEAFTRQGEEKGLEGQELESFIRKKLSFEAEDVVGSIVEKQPKLDFKPAGMKTPEQLNAEAEVQKQAYHKSFDTWRGGFKGIQVGDAVIPFEAFDADGKATEAFMPVIEALNKPHAFIDSLHMEDGVTPDAAKIADLLTIKAALPAIIERAKSDALKEHEKKLMGNGTGYGNGAGDGGTEDITSGDWYAKTVLGGK